jgi:hypothetical protein
VVGCRPGRPRRRGHWPSAPERRSLHMASQFQRQRRRGACLFGRLAGHRWPAAYRSVAAAEAACNGKCLTFMGGPVSPLLRTHPRPASRRLSALTLAPRKAPSRLRLFPSSVRGPVDRPPCIRDRAFRGLSLSRSHTAGAWQRVLSRNSSVSQSALGAISRATDHCTRPQTICDMVRPQNARIVFFGRTGGRVLRRGADTSGSDGPRHSHQD